MILASIMKKLSWKNKKIITDSKRCTWMQFLSAPTHFAIQANVLFQSL